MKISDTNTESWETLYEEHVLQNSDTKEYFFDTVGGLLIYDDSETNQPMYVTWFSNEVRWSIYMTQVYMHVDMINCMRLYN